MSAPISTPTSLTAEDQILRIAMTLRRHYQIQKGLDGTDDPRYTNRVQIDIDYTEKSASLRFRIPLDFDEYPDSVRFVGVDPNVLT
ncbi:MAG: hypothetical protein ACRDBG_22295 [Waterburya sp.]